MFLLATLHTFKQGGTQALFQLQLKFELLTQYLIVFKI